MGGGREGGRGEGGRFHCMCFHIDINGDFVRQPNIDYHEIMHGK